jgi:hypothetical protein
VTTEAYAIRDGICEPFRNGGNAGDVFDHAVRPVAGGAHWRRLAATSSAFANETDPILNRASFRLTNGGSWSPHRLSRNAETEAAARRALSPHPPERPARPTAVPRRVTKSKSR